MTEQEAIDALKEHKKLIDKKYLKAKNSEAIKVVLNVLKEKDKIIDLMAEQLAGLTIFDIDKDEPLILSDKEDVKQYFENKAKEK